MSRRYGSEFSKVVIDAMRLRVGARCSNPDCRAPTTGPLTDPKKVCSLGQAAHIHAASSGGPRGKPEMTPEERKDISNGVWLCLPCARKIDLDESLYTADLLRSWKRAAENQAQLEISRPIDLQELQLARAGIPRNMSSMSVANAVEQMRQDIISKDSRFDPEIRFDGTSTHITMNVTESISCTIEVSSAARLDFDVKLQALLEHGESLEMDASLLKMRGSPVFEDFSDDAIFILEPANSKKAIFKVRFIDPDGSDVLSVDDIFGTVILGTKSFKFSGEIFDGLCSVHVRKGIDKSLEIGAVEEIVEFSFDYSRWLNKELKNLPYFEKAFALARALSSNCSSKWEMEVEGEVALRMHQRCALENRSVMSHYYIFPYIDSVRKICSAIGLHVKFIQTNISSAEAREAYKAAIILSTSFDKVTCGSQSYMADVMPQTPQQVKLINDLIASEKPHAVKIENAFPVPIRIFNTQIQIEPVILFLSEAVVKKHSSGVAKKGVEMKIELVTTATSSLTLQFAKGPRYTVIN